MFICLVILDAVTNVKENACYQYLCFCLCTCNKNLLLCTYTCRTQELIPHAGNADFLHPGEEAFNSPGNDFYFAFVDNLRISPFFTQFILRISIAPMKNETIQVVVEESGSTRTISTSLDNITEVDFAVDMRLRAINEREKGIHVMAVNGEDISVVALGLEFTSADTFKVLPYVYLPNDGYEYYAVSVAAYGGEDFVPMNSFIAVVAVEDGTVLTMELAQDVDIPLSTATQFGLETTTIKAGQVHNISLQQRQTLYIHVSTVEDLTGSRVVSNKPISFISGHECGVVYHRSFCDQLVEQIPPTSTWGTEFYTVPVVGRDAYDIFRVIASRDNTFIVGSCVTSSNSGQISRTFRRELSAGKVMELSIRSDEYCLFTSDKPTSLFQFSVWSIDPFMVMIPPTQQYQDTYIVHESIASLGVVVPVAYDRSGVLLNGDALIPDSGWVDIPCQDSSSSYICAFAAQVTIDNGYYYVSHANPEARFSVIVHSLGYEIGHVYMGGMTQKPIACTYQTYVV